MNPIIEQSILQRKERELMLKYAHKFLVIGIYDWNKPVKEEVFDTVRIYCTEHHIRFRVREFSPDTIEEDKEDITSLPAYHIYKNDNYIKTIYPSTDCINDIKMIILAEDLPCIKLPKNSLSFQWSFPTLFRKKAVFTSKIAPSYES